MVSSVSLIGTVLDGKYKVDRLLGRGGMGEVYAGTHLRLERTVAIKILHGDLNDNVSFVARFAREARTAAKLEHPNAVHVYDFGSLKDGSTYLVMEFIEGVTLREVLRANGRLDPKAAINLIRQAAGAVEAAHKRGIIHRDLKPENMMVRQDDAGQLILKVVDFGLAKMLENTTSQLTNKSELMGTPKYMAPEQFQSVAVDGRADVYALGCVLFELLAGRTPFEGTFIEIVGKHVYADVPMVADFGVELPAALEAAIRKALEKDPANRLATAGDFVRDLDAAVGTMIFEEAGVTIPIRAAETLQAGVIFPTTDESDTMLAGEGLDDDDPLRTRRDARPATPLTAGTASDRATVHVPDMSDAADTLFPGKASRPTSIVDSRRVAAGEEETASLPTRIVSVPQTARRTWVIPAALAMSAVVAVAAWQGLADDTSNPAPTNAVLPVAPAVVPVENVNAATDTNTDVGEPVDNERIDADDPSTNVEAEAPEPPSTPRASRSPAAPKATPPPVPPAEVNEMRPTPETNVEGLTPMERRRLRKMAERMERERRRREAIRESQQRP